MRMIRDRQAPADLRGSGNLLGDFRDEGWTIVQTQGGGRARAGDKVFSEALHNLSGLF